MLDVTVQYSTRVVGVVKLGVKSGAHYEWYVRPPPYNGACRGYGVRGALMHDSRPRSTGHLVTLIDRAQGDATMRALIYFHLI